MVWWHTILLPVPRHYLAVPPGPQTLFSSMIHNSPILASNRGIPDKLSASVPAGVPGSAGGAGTSQFEFGVDPTLDPELAMVRFRSKIASPPVPSILFFPFFRPCGCLWKRKPHGRRMPTRHHCYPGAAAPTAEESTATAAAAGPGGVFAQPPARPTDESGEAIIQQTLALSGGRAASPDVEMTEDHEGDENLTEEEMILRANETSMHPEPESEEKK